MTRPAFHTYMMTIADAVAQRSTCSRRSVGCVLTDYHGRILATGYNGVPMEVVHCIDKPCEGATYKSGEGLDKCLAVHAEANALIQCRDQFDIAMVFCTTFPCIHCLKMLMNTSAMTIFFRDDYDNQIGKRLWIEAGRKLVQLMAKSPRSSSSVHPGNTLPT